jgi:hypothetical protein
MSLRYATASRTLHARFDRANRFRTPRRKIPCDDVLPVSGDAANVGYPTYWQK